MTLADFLKEYRKRMQISQRTLAQRCGVSHSYIGFLESGINPTTKEPIKPSLVNLHKIANGMGMGIDELLSALDDMTVSLDDGVEMRVTNLSGIMAEEEISKEKFIIEVYRAVNSNGKQRLAEYANFIYENYRKEENP